MKTKQILFHGAWLLTAAAALTGCSSEDGLITPEVPAKTTWTVVVSAEKTVDDATRAITVEGTKLKTTWETADKVYVIKADGTLQNGSFAPQTTGERTTTLTTSDLEGDYAVGDVLTLRSRDAGRSYAGQKGTISDVSANHAFMEAEVTVTAVDTENKTLTLSDATFKHCQAFLKLKFTDGTNALAVSKLKISDQKNFTLLQGVTSDGAKQYEDMTIEPDEAASELFIALHNDKQGTDIDYTLTVTVGGEDYKVTKKIPYNITDGKYGSTSVPIDMATEIVTEYKDPLTFEAVDKSSDLTMTYMVGSDVRGARPIKYRTSSDGETWGAEWTDIAGTVGESYTMTGKYIQVRGSNGTYGHRSNYNVYSCTFTGDKEHYVYGNIMSLVDAENYATKTTLQTAYTFMNLFSGNANLRSHSEKDLVLPATTLADYCYNQMFYGCTSLTTAPELPVTTMANNCYQGMFYGCTGLTTAPELPATTLADYCYNQMFNGCTGLTEAPALLATTLPTQCYFQMFYNCKNLTKVKCLATDLSADKCTWGWLNNVSSSGTLVIKTGMKSSWEARTPERRYDGVYMVTGIPSGWTVEEADE